MENKKELSKEALINNLNQCLSFGKEIIAMVKADAYGHGLKPIVSMLKSRVNCFGVANIKEALNVKRLTNNKNKILIVGKTKNIKIAIKNDINFSIDSFLEVQKVQKVACKLNTIANVHIIINTGMNRYGIKQKKEFAKILNYIRNSRHINLCGVYTHLFNADKKKSYAEKQISEFQKYLKLLKPNECTIHIGGSFSLCKNLPKHIDAVRVGFFLYGYGNQNLQPVMSIKSKIIKITHCKKGEYVGYGNNKLIKSSKIALIPVGYADGLPRRLSNIGNVVINGFSCKIIGNICMDCFMVDISKVGAKVGDFVQVFTDAQDVANLTKTSAYEILTNFSKFRGKTEIVN